MTGRTLRNRTAGIELETGGNPLSNPYATFPIEEPSEEEINAEAKRRANELIDNFLSGKDRNPKAKMEMLDALVTDEVFVAFLNLYKVMKSCDCAPTSKKYFDASQRLVQAFDAQIEAEMLFDITHE